MVLLIVGTMLVFIVPTFASLLRRGYWLWLLVALVVVAVAHAQARC